MNIIEIAWWISLMVITAYHLLVFRKKEEETAQSEATEIPGVSIVIAVKNGSKALLQNLPSLCHQSYPLFELIIVDDHSSIDEKAVLEKGVEEHSNVRLIHSDLNPGKKQALSLGIEEASYELILCTDADCYPTSSDWVLQMVKSGFGKNMVLGYSPYGHESGLLNLVIRFETIMTGMQYLSWAKMGKPYMGVGRNILYPRSLFQQHDPYKGQQHIPYGDDDLWVQKAAAVSKVSVCLDKEAHVVSVPASSLSKWLRQKHRHLSAGHHYDAKSWWQPAGFAIALILHWILIIPLVIIELNPWVFGFLLLGLMLRWQTHNDWTRMLGDRDTNYWFPVLEIIYAVYLAGMSLFTTILKKKTWN